ncbi:hypothetical protein GALMADRAFT_598101 [Galerina marginata CBS 339.88]|uniref:Uncharacterized protein n=1 Tax=Galerina marginata (strain CBS 339.88) TaxID=685588 RepID=A0A067T4U0_GALM3|nr:hypothetical protein GALMADRAFT_598101 [Galerina marginata CBS 339.88]
MKFNTCTLPAPSPPGLDWDLQLDYRTVLPPPSHTCSQPIGSPHAGASPSRSTAGSRTPTRAPEPLPPSALASLGARPVGSYSWLSQQSRSRWY